LATRITQPSGAMRKRPQQARSRATIDAILDAAAHILGERGWAGLTTNAVAEAAGASIGSLYQYFPDKLALIDAVRRRHFNEVLEVLHAAANLETPRADRIAALVDGMIAMHSRHPAAHRVLLEESPRGEDSRSAHDLFGRDARKPMKFCSRRTFPGQWVTFASVRRCLVRRLRVPYMQRNERDSFHRGS